MLKKKGNQNWTILLMIFYRRNSRNFAKAKTNYRKKSRCWPREVVLLLGSTSKVPANAPSKNIPQLEATSKQKFPLGRVKYLKSNLKLKRGSFILTCTIWFICCNFIISESEDSLHIDFAQRDELDTLDITQ